MKSKIVSLSKNSEFLSLLNGNKIVNKYSTIFFKKLKNKNHKCLNVSFVALKNKPFPRSTFFLSYRASPIMGCPNSDI